jgi:L-fuconolactonase
MFGSDWPVCLVASNYGQWMETVAQLAADFSQSEQDRLFGETACEVYGLSL